VVAEKTGQEKKGGASRRSAVVVLLVLACVLAPDQTFRPDRRRVMACR
jgi:hypothetical protein